MGVFCFNIRVNSLDKAAYYVMHITEESVTESKRSGLYSKIVCFECRTGMTYVPKLMFGIGLHFLSQQRLKPWPKLGLGSLFNLKITAAHFPFRIADCCLNIVFQVYLQTP